MILNPSTDIKKSYVWNERGKKSKTVQPQYNEEILYMTDNNDPI